MTPSSSALSLAPSQIALAIANPGALGTIDAYIGAVNRLPMLTAEREADLGRRLRDHNDLDAARDLILSHLRLVVSIARQYLGYGLAHADLIQEGNIGLMKAVRRFDPDRGVRLVSFAVHWIRAEIHEYVVRNWRLVKIATTKAQRKLFFNLRRLKGEMKALDEGDLKPEQAKLIADKLNVTEAEVYSMNGRMSGSDASLNVPMGTDGDMEWQDWLADDDQGQAADFADKQEYDARMDLLANAMEDLNERERHILTERRLSEEPKTLEELSETYNVSRERIRQIEVRAFEKLQKAMKRMAKEQGLPVSAGAAAN
jgi:RNA polymerase sigma-32 factor